MRTISSACAILSIAFLILSCSAILNTDKYQFDTKDSGSSTSQKINVSPETGSGESSGDSGAGGALGDGAGGPLSDGAGSDAGGASGGSVGGNAGGGVGGNAGGGTGTGGSGGTAGTGAAGDVGASAPTPPPISAGFLALGGRRTDGTISLYDDGFEIGVRSCTADGRFCVTGGLTP
jgi:hypothetical protein